MFVQSLDPTTGRVPEPRTPDRGWGSTSLEIFSRSAKQRACNRVIHFGLWQGARSLLMILINLGRGSRCRSWYSDKRLSEFLKRSGRGTYSYHHLRKCRYALENAGLIRTTQVHAHYDGPCRKDGPCKGGHFPAKSAPDVDGGGLRAGKGGKIVEVNVAAILGTGDRWAGPLREQSWQERHEAAEAPAVPPVGEPEVAWSEGENPMPRPSAARMAEDLHKVFAAPDARAPGREQSRDRGRADHHCAAEQSVVMDADSPVVMDDDSCDPESENLKPDRGRGARRDAQPPAARTTADAGRPCGPGCDATPRAAHAAPDAPSPNGTPRPRGESERQRTNEEQSRGQAAPPPRRAGIVLSPFAVEAPIAAKDLARLRELCPDVDFSRAHGGEVRARPRQAPADAPPPPATVRPLFAAAELGPVGRHGERPAGWRPPGGGGGSS